MIYVHRSCIFVAIVGSIWYWVRYFQVIGEMGAAKDAGQAGGYLLAFLLAAFVWFLGTSILVGIAIATRPKSPPKP